MLPKRRHCRLIPDDITLLPSTHCRHEAEFLKKGAKAELRVDGGPVMESEVARAASLNAKTSNLFVGEWRWNGHP